MSLYQITSRLRRNRKSEAMRSLIQETHLTSSDFIAPFFITEGTEVKTPISSLPTQFYMSLDSLEKEVEELLSLGIKAILLFPVVRPQLKDAQGSYGLSEDNFLLDFVQRIKSTCPEICVCADIALDPFTSHGHDGLISKKGEVLNDPTVASLTQMSLLYAQAGVDIVAPSDMMDGRVMAIRKHLDENQYDNVSIMAYSAKYASHLYGPFRSALQSALLRGDKKGYQLNPANAKEAVREAIVDEKEGADILMVKPATLYLDVIQSIRKNTLLPLAAYHVSGEYAMLQAAAAKGWLNFNLALQETLLSIKRAGADIIVTYGAKEVATLLKEAD